jgi:hypothetical protein
MATFVGPDRAAALREISWDDVAAEVYLPNYRALADGYRSLLGGVTTAGVAGLVTSGQLDERVVDADGRRPPPEYVERAAAFTVAAALATGLTACGWTLENEIGGAMKLRHGDRTLKPFEAYQEIRDDPAAWEKHCLELGIDQIPLLAGPVDDAAS